MSKLPIRIFNREPADTHPFLETLSQPLMAGEPSTCWYANLRHDPRVGPEREAELLAFISGNGSGSLTDDVGTYTWKNVQNTADPSFLKDTANLVTCPGIVQPLRTVFIVNGPWPLYAWARKEWHQFYRSQPDNEVRRAFATFQKYPATAPRVSHEAKNFVRQGMSEAGTFMESLGIVHQIYSEQYPYNPIWLTRGLDLPHDMPGEASIQRAIRWTQRVGVSVEKKEGEFVCLLEFPPLPSLYHPTVLDGVTAYFCPTPESFVPQVVGGAAMDLNTCSMDFAQEFIAVWPDMRFAKCLGPAEIPDLASCIKCYDARPDHLNKLEREPGIQSVSVEWIGRVRAD